MFMVLLSFSKTGQIGAIELFLNFFSLATLIYFLRHYLLEEMLIFFSISFFYFILTKIGRTFSQLKKNILFIIEFVQREAESYS